MKSEFPALYWKWNAALGVMKPMLKGAAAWFEDGALYRLEPRAERSAKSQRHYFASVREAWRNLPEGLDHQFKSPEHLRAWALIDAGYCDEKFFAAKSHDEAVRIAAYISELNDHAIVTVADDGVRVFTAKSQSSRAMDAKEFQESKTAVLDAIAKLIGVNRGELQKQSDKP